MKANWLRIISCRGKVRRIQVLIGAVLCAAWLIGCGGGGGYGGSKSSAPMPAPTPTGKTIAALQSNQTLASTVAPNGDKNPYGLATPPASYSGGAGNVLQPGDILITNFSAQTGTNTGTTTMRYVPATGQMSLFYTNKVGTGPTALAIGPTAAVWIANYQLGYINLADGATTGDGNVIVVAADGSDLANNAGIIDNNSGVTFDPSNAAIAGPWGEVYATGTPFFFLTQTNLGAGFVQRQEVTASINATHLVTIGQLPTGSNAFDPTGPQGMVYDATRDILYVASTANNSIVAFADATKVAASFAAGTVVYSGAPLNAPVGLTMNPTNGNLIAVNQLDNNMVEIAPNPSLAASGGGGGGYSPVSMMATPPNVAPQIAAAVTFGGKLIATKMLDDTPVDANAGTGSALFGVLAVRNAAGDLLVYYTNSNTNTLNVLK